MGVGKIRAFRGVKKRKKKKKERKKERKKEGIREHWLCKKKKENKKKRDESRKEVFGEEVGRGKEKIWKRMGSEEEKRVDVKIESVQEAIHEEKKRKRKTLGKRWWRRRRRGGGGGGGEGIHSSKFYIGKRRSERGSLWIAFNDISIRPYSFYAYRLGNRLHICIFVLLFT